MEPVIGPATLISGLPEISNYVFKSAAADLDGPIRWFAMTKSLRRPLDHLRLPACTPVGELLHHDKE
jgi:hypothetical protein